MKNNKLKIVYLINGLGTGGAEMMLYRLLERIDRETYQPVVVTLLKLPGPLQAKVEALGINVHVIGIRSKTDLYSIKKLFEVLKELSPQILHTQLFAADILGRFIGNILKVPVVVTGIRNVYYGNFLRYFLYRATERFAQRTVFVSHAAAKRFVELNVVPEKKIQVIHNGLEAERFYSGLNENDKKSKRKSLGLPEEELLLLAVGSLTRQKGYSDLFRALKIIKRDFTSFKLVIAGGGSLKKDLEQEAEALHLNDKLVFLGRRDDVPELMAAADMLVLSSLWEGLPGAVLEAMASELPVVATTVGGTPELVIEGKTGYLVSPGDPEALGAGLKKMMLLPVEERNTMGKAGRSRVEEYFHIDKMIKEYEGLYQEAIKCLQL